ncbi:MAG: hypothetical protein CME13_15470 [Gemmatimonadetes bacterium]|nr:hypothetical protein [Gemmatimonadota bacterium]
MTLWLPQPVSTGFLASGPTCFRLNALMASWDQVSVELAAHGIDATPLDGLDGVFTVPTASHRVLTDTAAARDGRINLMTPSSVARIHTYPHLFPLFLRIDDS